MKRFLSTLLVAMLIVTCLATAAFAAAAEKVEVNTVNGIPGKQATVTFTVTGEFASYELYIKYDSKLKLISEIDNSKTAINGSGAFEANEISTSDKFGKVTFASSKNISKHTFTVTFVVPENATCGNEFEVFADLSKGFVADVDGVDQAVSVQAGAVKINHDWVKIGGTAGDCQTIGTAIYECSICGEQRTEDGVYGDHSWSDWMPYSAGDCQTLAQEYRECSVCGEKEYRDTQSFGEHAWSEWTVVTGKDCSEETYRFRECSICGDKETEFSGEYGAHAWSDKWNWNMESHWHECSICHEKKDHGAHVFPDEGVKSDDGKMEYRTCSVCGYIHGEPITGDVQIQIISGIAAMSAVLAAAAFVCKRKFLG